MRRAIMLLAKRIGIVLKLYRRSLLVRFGKERSRALATITAPLAPYWTAFQARLDRLTVKQQRIVAASSAVFLQLLAVLLLAIGLRVSTAVPSAEVTLSMGGELGTSAPAPKPPLIVPETPVITPPVIDIADTITSDETPTPGSPDVTMPAMAIAEAHALPALPDAMRNERVATVRLLIEVSEGGSISDAHVQSSCGNAALDQLAIEWVKAHWRYKPALRNGVPYGVETTAIVAFLRA